MALLDIRHLSITINTPHGKFKALDRVSLLINEGEIRGLLGESGSGKSLIAKAIIGATKTNWTVTADRFRLNGIDLLKLSSRKRRKIVAQEIGIIFQEPSSYLDPSIKIDKQLKFNLSNSTFTGKWWRKFKWKSTYLKQMMHKVGIRNYKVLMNSYPHELTEGECQKIMIIMAIANKPKIIIADDPTNGLDIVTEDQIFRLLNKMNQISKTSILLISHDLNRVINIAHKITVLYCGQAVESGTNKAVTSEPHHPYTKALLNAIPSFNTNLPHKSKLTTLKGSVPPMEALPIGCRLGPRCPYAQRKCVEIPPQTKLKNHKFFCHFPLNLKS